MDPNEISAAIDRMFAAYGAGDLDGFAAGVAEDVHYQDTGGGPPLSGRAAFRDYAAGWFDACSGGRLVPVRKIISGDEAAVEMRFAATHDRGPLYGVAPAGKRIEFDFAVTLRFTEKGEVSELKAWYSPLAPMQAVGLVGALPVRPAAA